MKRVYLDHSATTPVHPEVLEAMLPYYGNTFGNPSSIHSFGQETKKVVDEAREKVALLIDADLSEIVFTGCGTEADNLALRGVAYANEAKGKHIITSSIEHHAIVNTCKYLEKKGFRITYLPVDKYGLVDPDEVKEAIKNDTILISIMYANNEVGTIEPISEIGAIAKDRGIYFHTDAVQAAGKIPVNVQDLKVDLLSMSAHKLYGPKGIGALYIRKGVRIVPLFYGGHQEDARRAGTENVPGIVGFGKTCEIALRDLQYQMDYLKALRDRLQAGIMEKLDYIHINGHPTQRLPNILNISFEFVEGESVVLNLDMEGIAASTGSACTSGSLTSSHILMSMGISHVIAQGSLRFSLGRENTKEEIDFTIKEVVEVVERLRSFSPLYPNRK
jgi:cysteine desulfurase